MRSLEMPRIRELPPSKPLTPAAQLQAWLRSEFADEQKRAANLVSGPLTSSRVAMTAAAMPVLGCFVQCCANMSGFQTLELCLTLRKLFWRAQSLLRAAGLFFGAVVVMRNFGEAFNV